MLIRTERAEHRVAPVFVGAHPTPADNLLTSLGCETTATPAGSLVSTDPTGETSVKGLWAIGNVTDTKALVPIAIGAGTYAATHINISLLEEDIEEARMTSEAEKARRTSLALRERWASQ